MVNIKKLVILYSRYKKSSSQTTSKKKKKKNININAILMHMHDFDVFLFANARSCIDWNSNIFILFLCSSIRWLKIVWIKILGF